MTFMEKPLEIIGTEYIRSQKMQIFKDLVVSFQIVNYTATQKKF